MLIYWLIFGAIAAIAVLSESVNLSKGVYRFAFAITAIVLFMVSVLQGSGVSRDYETYRIFYQYYGAGGVDLIFQRLYEPVFFVASVVGTSAGLSVNFVYLVHVGVSLVSKSYLFLKASSAPLLSLLLYYSYFYFLHDVTQIRISAAIGIAYIGLWLAARRSVFVGLPFIFLGALFHFSAIVLIAALILVRRPSLRLSVFFLVSGVVSSFLIVQTAWVLDVLSVAGGMDPTGRLAVYIKRAALGEADINIIKRLSPHAVLVSCLLYQWARWKEKFRGYSGWVCVYSFGIFVFGMLCVIPHVAYRLSDIFFFSGVVAVPFAINIFRQKLFGRVLVVSVGLLFFVYVIHGVNLVGPYVLMD